MQQNSNQNSNMAHAVENKQTFLKNVSRLLTTFINSPQTGPQKIEAGPTSSPPKKTKFTSSVIPKISIQAYLDRIYKYIDLNEPCVLSALIYLDRYITQSGIPITLFEIHRILAVSCMISAKFLKDNYLDNELYAKVAGVSLKEINILEAEFLKVLDFKVFITVAQYENCLNAFNEFCSSPEFTKPETQETPGGLIECMKSMDKKARVFSWDKSDQPVAGL